MRRKSNVVSLALEEEVQPDPPEHKEAPVDDDVFFHKGQLHVGTHLLCLGRLDPRSQWVVEKITSWFPGEHSNKRAGKYYEARSMQTPRHLTDEIQIRRIGSQVRRSCKFTVLSYSAIWRIAK